MKVALPHPERFTSRHIGPRPQDIQDMVETLGYASLDALIDAVVPEEIRLRRPLALPKGKSEREVLRSLRALAGQNEVGPLALEVRGEEEVRVRDGYDGAVRLNGNGRYAVARVKGFTPRVKHDLTLIRSFSENPAPGMLLP